jgi:HK97 family phage portal protein
MSRVMSVANLGRMLNDRKLKIPIFDAYTAYEHSGAISKAVNFRASSTASLPVEISNRKTGTLVDWPLHNDPGELVRKVVIDVDIAGHSLWQVSRSPYSGVPILVHVASEMIDDVKLVNETVDGLEYVFHGKSHTGARWSLNSSQVLYFRRQSRYDDNLPVSRVEQVIDAASLLYALSRYGAQYMADGAMPTTFMSLPSTTDGQQQITSKDEWERFKREFSEQMRGVMRGVGRIVGLNRKLEFHQLTPNLNDMALLNLSELARDAIGDTFEIPRYLIDDDSANYATARQSTINFYELTISPLARWIARTANQQYFYKMGLEMSFDTEAPSAYKPDETARSNAVLAYTNAGIEAPDALEILGFGNSRRDRMLLEQIRSKHSLAKAAAANSPQNDTEALIKNDDRDAERDEELRRLRRKMWKARKAGRDSIEFRSEILPEGLIEAAKGYMSGIDDLDVMDEVMQQLSAWEAYG